MNEEWTPKVGSWVRFSFDESVPDGWKACIGIIEGIQSCDNRWIVKLHGSNLTAVGTTEQLEPCPMAEMILGNKKPKPAVSKPFTDEWTQEKLDALLKEWQGVLRLQDWDITIRKVRGWDMDGSGRSAEIEHTITTKEARISIIDPVDYKPTWLSEQDVELDIIHELGHLHFAPFWDDCSDKHEVEMEQALNNYAKSLIEVKRQGVVLHG